MSVRFMRLMSWSAVGILVLLTEIACTMISARPQRQVTTPQEVPLNMVVIVGRIELRPALQASERSLMTMRGNEPENGFILYCGTRPMDFNTGAPDVSAESFSTTLEKDFFIKVRRDSPLIISGGTFSAASGPPLCSEGHTFSSPLRIDLRPDDQAVYIGTIQYYRDGSNKLKSIMVRDDYEWAAGRFRKRFGTVLALRKALAIPVPHIR